MLRGLLLLGTGRAQGFGCFQNDGEGLLAALAPPLAFLLVLAVLLLMQHPTAEAGCLVLLLLCAVLLPPVLSHRLARLWKRDREWPRYATASAWSVWLVLPAWVPAMLAASVLTQIGIGPVAAGNIAMLVLGLYMLWLQWFMAWKGLAIGRLRAVLAVLVLGIGSSALALGIGPLMRSVLVSAPSGPAPDAR